MKPSCASLVVYVLHSLTKKNRNPVMKKLFEKYFFARGSFYLLLMSYAVIYLIFNVDKQIPIYKVGTTKEFFFNLLEKLFKF